MPQHAKNEQGNCIDQQVNSLLADLKQLQCSHQTLSRKALDTAIKDLVGMVDNYFSFCAFEFLSCAGGDLGSNFECLNPLEWSIGRDIATGQALIDRYDQLLNSIFADKQLGFESNLSNVVDDLTTNHRESGFYMGILVGTKMMGASSEQMQQLGKRMLQVILAEPRYQTQE